MTENYRSNEFLPTTTGSDFGYAMALVETIRILTAIDKKMYVVIKKLENLAGNDNSPDKDTIFAEDMGYQAEDHDLSDK